jgi:hypothetical protein
MRHVSVFVLCAFAATTASLASAGVASAQPRPAAPVATVPVQVLPPPSASLVSGPYDLVLTASKGSGAQAVTKTSTFKVQAASNGSSVTFSTPPTGTTPGTTFATATGAFSGKSFSLQLVIAGDTLLMSAVAPSATTVSALNGNFVTSKPGKAPVTGTFTLTKSAPAPQAHVKQIKQYGDDPPTQDGSGAGIIETIGNWIDSLFNWG